VKRRVLGFALVGGLLAATAALPAEAVTIQIAASDDATQTCVFTEPLSCSVGHSGPLTWGRIGSFAYASALEFDLGVVPVGAVVESALLWLTPTAIFSAKAVYPYLGMDGAITQSDFDTCCSGAYFTFDFSSGASVSVDVTALVQAFLAGDDFFPGFLLSSDASGLDAVHSLESSTPAFRPRLEVQYTLVPEPRGLLVAGFVALAGRARSRRRPVAAG